MFTPAEEAFLNSHRWAVLSHLAADGAPSSSVVAFARDGDEFVVSTPGGTAKRRRIAKDGRVNLCVISNREPFNFIALQGVAQVNRDDLLRRTRLVFDAISDTGWTVPDDLEGWLQKQQRVIISLRPTRHHTVLRD